jgi:hypothetical protein
VKSCSVATAVISNTSPVWTISRPASAHSIGSPNRVALKGANSRASIFSAASNRACSPPCSVLNIAGLRRADLGPLLTQCSLATLSRQLARLRQLGVIKRVTGTFRCYLTRAGRAAIAAGRRLTEHTIIPALT